MWLSFINSNTLILFVRATKLIKGSQSRISCGLCVPWLNPLAEVSHQWRETCLGSQQTRPNSSPKHSWNYRVREAEQIFICGGLGFFKSLDISEPFFFFYNSFGMYWPSKITNWESSGYGNQRQEQFTTSLTNLLSMFLWQILIFSTAYLCYRLKTLVVGQCSCPLDESWWQK